MAFTTKVAFLALASLLILSAPQAHALLHTGVSVTSLIVRVGVHCQANPAGIATGPGLLDIPVTLMLNGVPIATANTDLDGISHIAINSGALLASILNIQSLTVRVGLPLVQCSIWAHTNGALVGPCLEEGLVGGVLTLVVNTLRVVA